MFGELAAFNTPELTTKPGDVLGDGEADGVIETLGDADGVIEALGEGLTEVLGDIDGVAETVDMGEEEGVGHAILNLQR